VDVVVERGDVAGVGPRPDVDVRGDDDVGSLPGLEPEQDAAAVVVPADRLEVGLDRYAVVRASLLERRVHEVDGRLEVLGAVDGRVVGADRPTDQVHGPLGVGRGGD